MTSPSVLIFGASGRVGKCLLVEGVQHPAEPTLHAFVRNPDKLSQKDKNMCTSVIQGDATNPMDVGRALEESQPDFVVIAIGTSHLRKQDVRERNAKAVVQTLGNGTKFEHVKVVVISAVGAGDSRMVSRFGIGSVVQFTLRKALADHDIQEDIFMDLNTEEDDRVLVVRPTMLTSGKPTGKTELFESDEKCPSIKIDRQDLAKWIMQEVCGDSVFFGTSINISNYKAI